MEPKSFDIKVDANLVVKQSPDFVNLKQKASAGVSEKDLIERYTIAELEQEEEQKTEETDV